MPVPGHAADSLAEARTWLEALAGELAARGMGTRIMVSGAGTEMLAWLPEHGHHSAEVVVDAHGYLECRHWAGLSDDPGHAAAAISAGLAALAPNRRM